MSESKPLSPAPLTPQLLAMIGEWVAKGTLSDDVARRLVGNLHLEHAALTAENARLAGEREVGLEVSRQWQADCQAAQRDLAEAREQLAQVRRGQGLTLRFCQERQPWTVPYSDGVRYAASNDVPHVLASHCVLHAAKSIGKLAAVFEALDHGEDINEGDRLDTVVAMSADLVTAALRFANLYSFDLETALDERVRGKNGVGYSEALAAPTAQQSAPSEPKRHAPGTCSCCDGWTDACDAPSADVQAGERIIEALDADEPGAEEMAQAMEGIDVPTFAAELRSMCAQPIAEERVSLDGNLGVEDALTITRNSLRFNREKAARLEREKTELERRARELCEAIETAVDSCTEGSDRLAGYYVVGKAQWMAVARKNDALAELLEPTGATKETV